MIAGRKLRDRVQQMWRGAPRASWEGMVLPGSYCEIDLSLILGWVFLLPFFMFKCIDFCVAPFAFSFCKDWWRKAVLGSDPLFVVTLAVSILKTKMDDGRCVSPICSVISANVRARFALCRTVALVSVCVLWCSFLNWNSDSCFAPRLGLVLSFPWLLSHLPLQQSHSCLLGPPSISICSGSNDVSWHLSDLFFPLKLSIQLCSCLLSWVIVLLLCMVLIFCDYSIALYCRSGCE